LNYYISFFAFVKTSSLPRTTGHFFSVFFIVLNRPSRMLRSSPQKVTKPELCEHMKALTICFVTFFPQKSNQKTLRYVCCYNGSALISFFANRNKQGGMVA
jgi:hypothetical protein